MLTFWRVYTPLKFNIAPENDGWKITFLLGWPMFSTFVKLPGSIITITSTPLTLAQTALSCCFRQQLWQNSPFVGAQRAWHRFPPKRNLQQRRNNMYSTDGRLEKVSLYSSGLLRHPVFSVSFGVFAQPVLMQVINCFTVDNEG